MRRSDMLITHEAMLAWVVDNGSRRSIERRL